MPYVTLDQAVSVDGYTAGVHQSLDKPFGEGAVDELTRWMIEGAEDNAPEREAIVGADAYIMGRNMFGPDRGTFDLEWTGWWGPEPPYHAPVFVLSHYEREPVELEGTTFHFVTTGIRDAFARASEVAGDGRISIAGGANTANQYLAAGLVDELRLHIAPVILGRGERLFAGVPEVRLEQVSSRSTALVTHITYRVVR
jgi:dihydrofolate reductase